MIQCENNLLPAKALSLKYSPAKNKQLNENSNGMIMSLLYMKCMRKL